MTAALRYASRRLVLGGSGIQRTPAVADEEGRRRLVLVGRGIQRTPAVAAEEGQRRLPPRFVHSGPTPSSRRFFSYQRGEDDCPLTFEEKVALWKRGGHLLFRTANAVATIVASCYILKLSVELGVNEIREPGYMVREAASLIKKSEDKLWSLWDR